MWRWRTTVLWGLAAAPALAAPTSVSTGYLGELAVHPGGFLAVERPVAQGPVLSLAAGGRAGLYHHPRHHTGAVLIGELTGRATAGGGLFGELGWGLGLQHRLVDGPVYVPAGGGVQRTVDLGRPTALSTFGLGLGWEIGRETDRPMRVFGRSEGWLYGPMNRRLVPGAALVVGVAWDVGGAP